MQGCFIYQHSKYICYQEITIMSTITILYLENTINPLIGARNIWFPLHSSSDAHPWIPKPSSTRLQPPRGASSPLRGTHPSCSHLEGCAGVEMPFPSPGWVLRSLQLSGPRQPGFLFGKLEISQVQCFTNRITEGWFTLPILATGRPQAWLAVFKVPKPGVKSRLGTQRLIQRKCVSQTLLAAGGRPVGVGSSAPTGLLQHLSEGLQRYPQHNVGPACQTFQAVPLSLIIVRWSGMRLLFQFIIYGEHFAWPYILCEYMNLSVLTMKSATEKVVKKKRKIILKEKKNL